MMKDVEVVVVEVVRVFIKQRVKGFGGPTEDWSRNGEAAERAALPNELEWAIEAESFQRRQGGQSVKTSPASLCTQRLNAAFWLSGVWASEGEAMRRKEGEAECTC